MNNIKCYLICEKCVVQLIYLRLPQNISLEGHHRVPNPDTVIIYVHIQ